MRDQVRRVWQSWWIRPAVVIVVLGAVLAGGYIAGANHALNTLTLTEITPTQAAEAMRTDDFYGRYRENILSISGEVATVSTDGTGQLVGFRTQSTYGAECQFDVRGTYRVGDTITVLTVAEQAGREPSGVRLMHCVAR